MVAYYYKHINFRISIVLSTSFGKTFFARRFILNENDLFSLTISQEPFVFSVSALTRFSNFNGKIIFTAKMGMTYAMSIVNWIYRKKILEIMFCFLHEFKFIDVP